MYLVACRALCGFCLSGEHQSKLASQQPRMWAPVREESEHFKPEVFSLFLFLIWCYLISETMWYEYSRAYLQGPVCLVLFLFRIQVILQKVVKNVSCQIHFSCLYLSTNWTDITFGFGKLTKVCLHTRRLTNDRQNLPKFPGGGTNAFGGCIHPM